MRNPEPLLVIANAEAGTADRAALEAALEVLGPRTDVAHERHRTISSTRGTRVRVTGSPFRCNSDGEIEARETRSRTWEVLPAAYSLVVPAGGGSGQESEHDQRPN